MFQHSKTSYESAHSITILAHSRPPSCLIISKATKVTEKVVVFHFSLQLLFQKFFSLINNQQDASKLTRRCSQCIRIHVNCLILSKTGMFQQILLELPNIKVNEKSKSAQRFSSSFIRTYC